jgi:hypothetical protein
MGLLRLRLLGEKCAGREGYDLSTGVRCRIGELDRRETFNALKDWAGDHFCVEDIRTRRLCQVVLRVFRRASELV